VLTIAGRPIGPESPPFVIAEVAQSHEGSLGNAFAFAEVARDCGAHAVKFQTHIAAEESTPSEPWRIPFSRQDASRYEYWRRMEFTFEQWAALKEHCDKLGIVFLSSPFSIRACEWLERLGVPAWKVASGEIRNAQLLEFMRATGKPMLLSTGLAAPAEATALARELAGTGHAVGLFHCTTQYPTPPDQVGLNVLQAYLTELAPIPVGLSDHTGSPVAGIVAAWLGAAMIEVHLTLHEKAFGPDVSSSLTPPDLKRLVEGSEAAWRMRRNPVDKDAQLAALANVRTTFGRSLFTRCAIPRGTPLGEDMLAYKKPAGGLAYEQRGELLGRETRRDLPPDHMLGTDDVV
jgi:N,N'-diacetyllegionaminate synthase